MKRKKSLTAQVRNWTAVAAHQRTNAGSHGGSPRQNNRRDRQSAKRALRDR